MNLTHVAGGGFVGGGSLLDRAMSVRDDRRFIDPSVDLSEAVRLDPVLARTLSCLVEALRPADFIDFVLADLPEP